jgi:hypothetical protein
MRLMSNMVDKLGENPHSGRMDSLDIGRDMSRPGTRRVIWKTVRTSGQKVLGSYLRDVRVSHADGLLDFLLEGVDGRVE